MGYNALPPHVLPATSHPTQTSLDLLDAGLLLCRNTRLERYEVWRRTLEERGVYYGFIIRVEDDGRPIEPGEWLLNKIRARDSRYRPADEAAREALADIKKQEQADEAAREHAFDQIHEELATEFIPLWRKKAEPDEFAREYKDWDKEPITFPMGSR